MITVSALLAASAVFVLFMALTRPQRPRRAPPMEPKTKSHQGLTQRQERWLLICGASCLAFMAGWAVFGTWHLGLLSSVIGVGAPGWVLQRRQERWRTQLTEQLEQLMGRLANTMGAGTTPEMAWLEAAAETPAPLGNILTDIANELRVGRTLEESLQARAHYLGLPEFELVAMSTSVLNGMGGNLAEAYRRAGETIAARRSDRAMLNSLTMETRLNGHIVALTPLIAFAGFRLLVPDYVRPVLNSFGGTIVLAVGAGLVFGGWVWMMRLASSGRLE